MGASEFVPPTRVELPTMDLLKELFGEQAVLVKDLQEGQIICTDCKGLGIQKNDFRYGLRSAGDPGPHATMFPYHEQVFGWCGSCHTGVQTLCKHCQKPYQKASTQCTCKAACDERSLAEHEKELERRKGCERIPYAEYKGEALYDADTQDYLYDGDDLDPSHTYFACTPTNTWVGVDKDDVIDRMRDRAEEEVEDGSEIVEIADGGEEKLEALLDAWFKENVTVREAYWFDDTTIVVVTPQDCGVVWDEDGDEYEDGEEKKLFPCAVDGCGLLLHPDKVGPAPQLCKKHKAETCAPSS